MHGRHTNSKIVTFADDMAVLVRHTNLKTAVTILQGHITKIEKWLQDKQIKANLNKCNHITFTLRQVIYLGLHLNTQLTWKQHTKSIIDKIRIRREQMYWPTSRNWKINRT